MQLERDKCLDYLTYELESKEKLFFLLIGEHRTRHFLINIFGIHDFVMEKNLNIDSDISNNFISNLSDPEIEKFLLPLIEQNFVNFVL